MAIRLDELPEHLALACVQKTELANFLKLTRSSKFANYLTNTVTKPIAWDLPLVLFDHGEVDLQGYNVNGLNNTTDGFKLHMAIDTLQINDRVTNKRCRDVILFLRPPCSVRKIVFNNLVDCSPNIFDRLLQGCCLSHCDIFLIKVSNAKALISNVFTLDTKYFHVPSINQIQTLKGLMKITEEMFFNLNIPVMNIYNDNVTCYAMNLFMKQWTRGERQFKFIQIRTWDRLHTDFILDDLPFQLVWNYGTLKYDYHVIIEDEVMVIELDRTVIRMRVF